MNGSVASPEKMRPKKMKRLLKIGDCELQNCLILLIQGNRPQVLQNFDMLDYRNSVLSVALHLYGI